MAMRYRNLRKKVKQTVGVYKSSIHGMGLFCKQPIDPAEMVIEYAGTVIRSALTDKREKYYNSKVSTSHCSYWLSCDVYRISVVICSGLMKMK